MRDLITEEHKTFSPKDTKVNQRNKLAYTVPKGCRVIVAGAGAFGGWSAFMLQRQGYKVTLIDPWGPGNTRSSSGGETRLIRAVYGPNETYFNLTIKAIKLWKEFQQAWDKKLMINTGVLWMGDDRGMEIVNLALKFFKANNIPLKEYSPRQASKIFPYINMEGVSGLVMEEAAGFLMAREATQIVTQKFLEEGGELVYGFATPGIIKNEKLTSVMLSNNSRLEADFYIFACGSWLPKIFPEILSDKITVTKQEVYYFGVPDDWILNFQTPMPGWVDIQDKEIYYGIPGFLDRGFKVAHDKRGPDFDPTHHDRFPDQDEIALAKKYLAKRFPGLKNAPLLESRVCQYSNTDTGNLIVDHHPEAVNVLILGGDSGHGFKYGPALGDYVSKLLVGEANLNRLFKL